MRDRFPEDGLDRVLEALSGIRIPMAAPEEAELHAAISAALFEAGLEARHEAPIAPRSRIDFLCGSVGIEVKKGKVPRARLFAQCERYLASPILTSLVLVSPRSLLLPGEIAGKRVVAYSLNKLWGVALP